MKHQRPTPEDPYCNECGLLEKYWTNIPECPAPEPTSIDDDQADFGFTETELREIE